MLTTEQQDNILSGDASFYSYNLSDAWIDRNKWYYLYLETDHYKLGRVYVKYTLSDKDGTIFSGNDFSASPSYDPLGDKSAEALLSFLTLGELDTEDEYFDGYNARQLDFRDCEAEDLYFWREQLNEEEV